MKIQMSPKNENLYSRLGASLIDLRMAQYCLETILDEKLNHTRHEVDDVTYSKQSVYTCALAVSYGRVFTQSKGWPPLPEELRNYDQEEIGRHISIMTLRHEVFAHTDSKHSWTGHYRSAERDVPLVMRPMMKIGPESATILQKMIGKLLLNIEERMTEM
jgi:hypothetical protein